MHFFFSFNALPPSSAFSSTSLPGGGDGRARLRSPEGPPPSGPGDPACGATPRRLSSGPPPQALFVNLFASSFLPRRGGGEKGRAWGPAGKAARWREAAGCNDGTRASDACTSQDLHRFSLTCVHESHPRLLPIPSRRCVARLPRPPQLPRSGAPSGLSVCLVWFFHPCFFSNQQA